MDRRKGEQTMRMIRRLLVMAVLGLLGALFGAGAGEALWLDAAPEPCTPLPRDICLVFDTSESMLKKTSEGRSQLEALRSAAQDFLATKAFAADTFALVGFSDEARVLCAPALGTAVRDALPALHCGGSTDIGRALDAARELLAANTAGERWIVLFTDGKPQTERLEDPVEAARRAAQACRDAGLHIVCVGTGLAEPRLLEELAGDPANVFVSKPEALGSAFQRTGERIQEKQMLATQPAKIDLERSLKRTCGWTALVAFGAGLALVSGHNRYLRRRMRPRLRQAALVLVGAALSGLVAGVAGQGPFYLLSGNALFDPLLRAAAWVLLGSGVVVGMSFFVPNLPRGRALVGGALGGAAAVCGFLRIAPEVGDVLARLVGAGILGCLAGSVTVLVEASVRRAWLVVRWPGGESTTLLLGAKPVVVGHSASAHICPVFDEAREAVLGHFTHGEGVTRFEDKRAGKVRRVRDGERLSFEPVVVEVHEERGQPEQPGAAPSQATASKAAESRTPSAPKAALPTRRERTRV
jgi:Ca-activated chloride channel family protein